MVSSVRALLCFQFWRRRRARVLPSFFFILSIIMVFIYGLKSYSPSILKKTAQLEQERALPTMISPSPLVLSTKHEQQAQEGKILEETKKAAARLNPATTRQHKTTLITKNTCAMDYFLLILVSSAPENLDRRRFIRETWGVDNALKTRWKTVFLLGQTRNQSQSNLLLNEDRVYGDMVRANYYDHYWNQTLKIQMGFEWAVNYCNFSFLLKADDDVFINTWSMISVLNSSLPKEKLYMGQLYPKREAKRKGKWKVSYEEYKGKYYPDFCPGFSYVFSVDVVHLFVDMFDQIPWYRLDDVYVGILANKAGVQVLNNNGFQVFPATKDCSLRANTLAVHGEEKECMAKLFHLASHDKIHAI